MKTIKLPFNVRKAVLACGADMKGAFALAKGRNAYLFEGFGDLGDPANMSKYERSVALYEKKLGIIPRIIACDHHPGYHSTRFAEMHGLRLLIPNLCDVQHHEAHIAAAIADNGIKGDVIGVAFDGTGLGWDGCIWGGEFFTGNIRRLKRAAHLEYIPMPGGEMAVKEPWRMALAYLYRAYGSSLFKLNIPMAKKLNKKHRLIMKKMLRGGINSPLTSSAGRLFDAASSIVLSREKTSFEAELPVIMEKIASGDRDEHYRFDICTERGMRIIEAAGIMRGMIRDIESGIDKGVISAKFHNTVAHIITAVALLIRQRYGVNRVVLSGGVFQNHYLTGRSVSLLRKSDFSVYTNSGINTNDYGIPIGQVAIANARGVCA
ncbi:MAG: carbamoyltransferase HypF [Candidatus Omnitrophica bacterium]|nr:carbamoyltransferase HypF [Candidatus Omnitrophota bacterium]